MPKVQAVNAGSNNGGAAARSFGCLQRVSRNVDHEIELIKFRVLSVKLSICFTEGMVLGFSRVQRQHFGTIFSKNWMMRKKGSRSPVGKDCTSQLTAPIWRRCSTSERWVECSYFVSSMEDHFHASCTRLCSSDSWARSNSTGI